MLNDLAKAGSFFIDVVRSFAAKLLDIQKRGSNRNEFRSGYLTDACFLFAVRGMRLRERMHFPYNTNSL